MTEDTTIVGGDYFSATSNPLTGVFAALRSSVQFVSVWEWIWSVCISIVVVFCSLIVLLALWAMIGTKDFSGAGFAVLFALPIVLLASRTLLTLKALRTYTATRRGTEILVRVVDVNQIATDIGGVYRDRYYPLLTLALSETELRHLFIIKERLEPYHLLEQSLVARVSLNKKNLWLIRGENGQPLKSLLKKPG